MKPLFSKASRLLVAIGTAAALTVPGMGYGKGVNEEPSAGAMAADAVVARPILAVTTVLGAGLFVATLPFTLAGGNADQAGKALVVEPAKNTFYRCLGCKHTGYQKK